MAILLLAYHRVNAWSPDALTVHPDEFRRQMTRLVRKYRVVRLSEIAGWLRRGELPGGNLAAITFDDGYRDNYLFACPILKALGISATFFVTAGLMDTAETPDQNAGKERGRLLTWAEAAEMAGEGFEIGSHTLTHPRLTECSPETVRLEVSGSRALLTSKLGRPVTLFCYPFGAHSGSVRVSVRESGYAAAVVTPPFRQFIRSIPVRLAGPPDLYLLPRVGVYRHTTEDGFRQKTFPALHAWRRR